MLATSTNLYLYRLLEFNLYIREISNLNFLNYGQPSTTSYLQFWVWANTLGHVRILESSCILESHEASWIWFFLNLKWSLIFFNFFKIWTWAYFDTSGNWDYLVLRLIWTTLFHLDATLRYSNYLTVAGYIDIIPSVSRSSLLNSRSMSRFLTQ